MKFIKSLFHIICLLLIAHPAIAENGIIKSPFIDIGLNRTSGNIVIDDGSNGYGSFLIKSGGVGLTAGYFFKPQDRQIGLKFNVGYFSTEGNKQLLGSGSATSVEIDLDTKIESHIVIFRPVVFIQPFEEIKESTFDFSIFGYAIHHINGSMYATEDSENESCSDLSDQIREQGNASEADINNLKANCEYSDELKTRFEYYLLNPYFKFSIYGLYVSGSFFADFPFFSSRSSLHLLKAEVGYSHTF